LGQKRIEVASVEGVKGAISQLSVLLRHRPALSLDGPPLSMQSRTAAFRPKQHFQLIAAGLDEVTVERAKANAVERADVIGQ
jgi:hypothetical protein